jgi:hypothetical protein
MTFSRRYLNERHDYHSFEHIFLPSPFLWQNIIRTQKRQMLSRIRLSQSIRPVPACARGVIAPIRSITMISQSGTARCVQTNATPSKFYHSSVAHLNATGNTLGSRVWHTAGTRSVGTGVLYLKSMGGKRKTHSSGGSSSSNSNDQLTTIQRAWKQYNKSDDAFMYTGMMIGGLLGLSIGAEEPASIASIVGYGMGGVVTGGAAGLGTWLAAPIAVPITVCVMLVRWMQKSIDKDIRDRN